MAKIEEAMNLLYSVEFNNSKTALEKNPTEEYLTFMGIYQGANKELELWKTVRQKLQQYNGDMKLTSEMLYDNKAIRAQVDAFYKKDFWDKMKLDAVASQNTANEMFLFGVNVGCKKAVMFAQQIVGVVDDGVVGPKTIAALNKYDDTVFSERYDELEQAHYDRLVETRPEMAVYLKGWKNRSKVV